MCEVKDFGHKRDETRQNFVKTESLWPKKLCWLLLSLSALSNVDCKILVLFRLIWNFKVLNLAMAKVKKVSIFSYLKHSSLFYRAKVKPLLHWQSLPTCHQQKIALTMTQVSLSHTYLGSFDSITTCITASMANRWQG